MREARSGPVVNANTVSGSAAVYIGGHGGTCSLLVHSAHMASREISSPSGAPSGDGLLSVWGFKPQTVELIGYIIAAIS